MNNDDVCGACRAFALLDHEIPPGHSEIWTCKCAGYQRFVWYGTVPKTKREAEKLFSAFLKAFELKKKPGPKKKQVTVIQIMEAIEKLPATATVTEVAGELEVSERTVQRVLKPFGGFHQMQEDIKSKGKPRVKKRFFKRIRRR